MCTAVGVEVLKYVIQHDIPGNARKMGEYLLAGLGAFKSNPLVKDVRGRGLLIALELKENRAEELMYNCLGKGLLINQLKPDLIRFIPPLIVSQKDIDTALRLLGQSLAELKN